MGATAPWGPGLEGPIDCSDFCIWRSWLSQCATLASGFSVCILSSNNGVWRTFLLRQAFGCSIHLWGSTNPLPCCYSAAAPLRSTAPLSQASTAAQPNVGADGGQLHPLAAVPTYRLFCSEAESELPKMTTTPFFPLWVLSVPLWITSLKRDGSLGSYFKDGHLVCSQPICRT